MHAADILTRAKKWIDALKSALGPMHLPGQIYSGDHWHVATTLPGAARAHGLQADLWVCSAGYGLIPATAPISPYSATFTRENPDCVYRSTDDADRAGQAWWEALAQWAGPQVGTPRRIAELAAIDPDAAIVVVASKKYLGAMSNDLREAREKLSSPEHLLIFSSGTTDAELGALGSNSIPCDARIESLVGGARFSLSARAARLALNQADCTGLQVTTVREWFTNTMKTLEPRTSPNREPMTDEQVLEYIRAELRSDPSLKKTALLRRLRDSGRACEQSRFGELFAQAKGTANG